MHDTALWGYSQVLGSIVGLYNTHQYTAIHAARCGATWAKKRSRIGRDLISITSTKDTYRDFIVYRRNQPSESVNFRHSALSPAAISMASSFLSLQWLTVHRGYVPHPSSSRHRQAHTAGMCTIICLSVHNPRHELLAQSLEVTCPTVAQSPGRSVLQSSVGRAASLERCTPAL